MTRKKINSMDVKIKNYLKCTEKRENICKNDFKSNSGQIVASEGQDFLNKAVDFLSKKDDLIRTLESFKENISTIEETIEFRDEKIMVTVEELIEIEDDDLSLEDYYRKNSYIIALNKILWFYKTTYGLCSWRAVEPEFSILLEFDDYVVSRGYNSIFLNVAGKKKGKKIENYLISCYKKPNIVKYNYNQNLLVVTNLDIIRLYYDFLTIRDVKEDIRNAVLNYTKGVYYISDKEFVDIYGNPVKEKKVKKIFVSVEKEKTVKVKEVVRKKVITAEKGFRSVERIKKFSDIINSNREELYKMFKKSNVNLEEVNISSLFFYAGEILLRCPWGSSFFGLKKSTRRMLYEQFKERNCNQRTNSFSP